MTISVATNRIRNTTTGTTSALSHSRTRFMVMALVVSVTSCMLNASMLSPAIRDINADLGPHGYASMSTYFHLSGAICTVVLIRWSDYIGRKRVLLAILVVQCIGTLFCIVVTVLRAGLVGATAVTALLAIFALDRNMVILLMPIFGTALAACTTPLAALGVVQAAKNEPGSLAGIANAGFGIGGSLGFAWAGTIVAQGTKTGFESALWICVAIGVGALMMSFILKPRPLVAEPPRQKVQVK